MADPLGRGLSAEEKRTKLLEIFRESKDIFVLKELEKNAPKLKGIVQQSVKEVLQSLIDDHMVQCEKIVYWSFPSQAGATITTKLDDAKKQLEALDAEILTLKEAIERERADRVDSPARTKQLAELAKLQTQLASLEKELTQYGRCDPVQIERKREAVGLAREAAVRWTDNTMVALQTLLARAGGQIADAEIRAHFGLEDGFEDLE
ncbi:meiotic nuclear division protein 1 [Auricularia subglabra TFB-10046 SS5]|nr:meiotic nuclear division protein 1 [Auricularia subglabra TFB-10046 SS5]